MTLATLLKFAFEHRDTKRKYLVGAFDRDEAAEMVAKICGDFNFEEIPLTDLPEEYQ